MSYIKFDMLGVNIITIDGCVDDPETQKQVRQILIELMSWFEQEELGDCLYEALNAFDKTAEKWKEYHNDKLMNDKQAGE